ncbi:hypothetical protein PR048_012617 [Dryococelus australis]|uniref:RNA-directed DNA polymerase n=1 Tax=Dryococelus australis TaxID=614101 RepID=A0ABQ9HQ14_9NEOP|nr:hypothetical protein PR048_012617 [Dryococelus australis]
MYDDTDYENIATVPEVVQVLEEKMIMDFYKWQRKDEECSNIYTYWVDKDLIFHVDCFKKKKLLVLIKVIDLVLKYFHSSTSGGHMGTRKTRALTMREFFWPGMGWDIDTFVQECKECQFAEQPLNSKMGSYSVKLPKALGKGLFRYFRSTAMIHSRVIKDLCFECGVKHIPMSSYYPCPNIVERVNINVKVALHIFHNNDQRGWDRNLPELCLTFNSVPHSAMGFSQCKIFLGKELPVPLLNVWGIPIEIMDDNSNSELDKI